jgi:hypothetical protein
MKGEFETRPLNLFSKIYGQKYTDSFEISKLKFTSKENAVLRVRRVRTLRKLPYEECLGALWLSVVTDFTD